MLEGHFDGRPPPKLSNMLCNGCKVLVELDANDEVCWRCLEGGT